MPARIAKLIYTSSALIIAVLTIATIAQSASLIHFRMEVANTEQRIATLQQQRQTLDSQLADATSIQDMQLLADNEGFISIHNAIALHTPSDSSVALR